MNGASPACPCLVIASVTTASRWEQPGCRPSRSGQTKCGADTVEYCPAFRRKGILTHSIPMNLEGVTLSNKPVTKKTPKKTRKQILYDSTYMRSLELSDL